MLKKNKYILLFLVFFLFKETYAEDLKNEFDNRIYSKINQFSQNLAEGLADRLKANERVKYFDISVP